MKTPRHKKCPQVFVEGFKSYPPLSKEDLSAIAKAPRPKFSQLQQLQKFRDGDAIVRGAMMKAQRQRRLRWIRAAAGMEDDSA